MDPLIKKTEKRIQDEIEKLKEGEITIPAEESEEQNQRCDNNLNDNLFFHLFAVFPDICREFGSEY